MLFGYKAVLTRVAAARRQRARVSDATVVNVTAHCAAICFPLQKVNHPTRWIVSDEVSANKVKYAVTQ